ncbi:MAG: septum formation initiator family protein [Erysipelotrichaceae bacterium]|nr:septum formation initiator family protein [Erysipelotrichaceae bacterium]MBQ4251953.1 septum formation initiator family protein [Erysipelotrichaceae bacterium]
MDNKKQPKKKKSAMPILMIIASVLMVGAIVFFALEISKEVETTFTLLTDISDAKKEIAELKEEEEKLIRQKEQLTDENYVRTWARGEYLITKEGEEIYRLPATRH